MTKLTLLESGLVSEHLNILMPVRDIAGVWRETERMFEAIEEMYEVQLHYIFIENSSKDFDGSKGIPVDPPVSTVNISPGIYE